MTEYTFSQLVDIAQVRQLLESHHRLSRMAYGILDPDENILVAVGWQDVCSRFHRSNPISNARCLESNTYIHDHLLECEGEYLESQCKNGLIDVALPIVISGKHVATFYAGQFFYDDRPDTTFFRNQASELGFDVDDYLASLELVPVFSRDYVRDNMLFLRNMVNVLAETGLNNFRHASEKEERKLTEQRLELLGFALDNVHEAAYLMDLSGRFHYVNQNACRSLGYTREELLGMAIPDIDPDYQEESLPHVFDRLLEQGTHTFETRHQAKDGRIFPVEITSTVLEHNGARYNLALVRDITERKAAQAMLEDERLLLKTLIQTLPDPVWLKDVNGVYIACNAAFGRLYDDTPSGIAGRTDNDYVDDELAAFFQQKDREAIAAGQPRTNEEWVTYAADGRRALWETTKTPVCDAQGRVVGALGVARDITERKRMEDALRKNERKYRTLAESLPDNIVRYDRECRATYYNSMLAESVAIEKEIFLGKTPLEAHPETEETAGLYESNIRRVLAGGAPGELEIVVPHPDGGLRTHLIRIVAEHDAEGAITGALAIGRDITDRKQTERQLQDARSRLFAVFTAIPDLVWLKNAAGIYLACNPAFEKFFGAAEAEIIGKNDHDFVPTELADFFIQKDREAMAAGRVCINEEEITYADDGRRGILETRKVPVYDVDGIISGVLGVARDITERKQTENALAAREREFRTLAENSPDNIIRYDRKCRAVYYNPTLARTVALDHQEMLGKTPTEAHPEGAKAIGEYEDKIRQVLESGVPDEIEIVISHPDGEFHTHLVRFVAERDAEGSILGVLAIGRDIHALKEAEKNLRASEQRFREIFDNSLDCLYLLEVTAAGRFRNLEINPAFERSTGMTRAELVGKYVDETVPEETGAAVVAKYRRCVAAGIAIDEEVELNLPGGHLFYHSTLIPVQDETGRIHRIVGITRDITERKEAEVALKNSERRLTDIINLLPDATFAIDLEGKITLWNRAAEEFTGARTEQMLGKGNYEHAIPFYGERRPILIDLVLNPFEEIKQRYPYAQNEDGLLSGEAYTLNAKRGEAYMLGVAAPLYDSEGKIIGAIESVRDITARKRTESALRESERQYRDLSEEFQTLLNGIPDLILHLSPQLSVVWANQAATEYVGHDPKGLPCYTLFHDRATPCERCPIIRAFASGENEEELMIDKGGRHWGVKAFPLKDQQGRVVSVIDYATDITEKMHLRDAAAQAKHLAALGELSAGVAHEINNPNGVILLNSAFLKRVFNEVTPLLAASARRRHPLLIAGMEIDEVLREMPLLLSEVHDGARRIQRIVDGLKEFVRTPVADPEPVDLNSVVAAAIRVTAAQIEAATAHFTITYGAGVETVQGCRQAIEQVVINLLTNACQALPDRERGIWITTRFLAESGKAMIEVRDAGSGILPENLPHITDPFFTTKRQSGGTGLGLSISNSLIKECGGTLQFFSSPGAGTTVTVILPICKTKDKR